MEVKNYELNPHVDNLDSTLVASNRPENMSLMIAAAIFIGAAAPHYGQTIQVVADDGDRSTLLRRR
jgi:hypothetical protein